MKKILIKRKSNIYLFLISTAFSIIVNIENLKNFKNEFLKTSPIIMDAISNFFTIESISINILLGFCIYLYIQIRNLKHYNELNATVQALSRFHFMTNHILKNTDISDVESHYMKSLREEYRYIFKEIKSANPDCTNKQIHEILAKTIGYTGESLLE